MTKATAPRPYEFLEHTADIRMHAWAEDLPGLFANCATGMMEYIFGEQVHEVSETGSEIVEVSSGNSELLIVDWLSAILCLNQIKSCAFVGVKFEQFSETHIIAALGSAALIATEEIKAVTHYDLKLAHQGNLWEVTVTFDI